jgi:hypothetical protein
MNGVWRGPAVGTILHPSDAEHDVTQTERIGPCLVGAVKVFEGRGYDATGQVTFKPRSASSRFDSGAKKAVLTPLLRHGDGRPTFVPNRSNRRTPGYVWDIPAGPSTDSLHN